MGHENTRIMVIEDNCIISYELKLLLEKMDNVVVSIIRSGEEAVKEVLIEKPDLVLMDINLSREMDGIEAAEKIHSVIDTPIIFITSNTDEATLRRAQKARPLGFIVKPYDNLELYSKIETALYVHRKRKIIKRG